MRFIPSESFSLRYALFLSKDKLSTAAELFTVMLSLNLIAKVISCVILEAKKTLTFMMNNLVLINNVAECY